jgi:hypothetical protein
MLLVLISDLKPDKMDDEEVSIAANDFQMIFNQNSLTKHNKVTHLNEKNFQKFLHSVDFTIVFYYLPCIKHYYNTKFITIIRFSQSRGPKINIGC